MDVSGHFEQQLVHTGQHYDESLSNVFFKALGIPEADVNLGVGSAASREAHIEAIAEAFTPEFERIKPDILVVVGDVNSTIACARVATAASVPVVHIEAGLRSFDDTMPEELNRVETDKLSSDLFVTEKSGMDNLQKEGVGGRAHLVGNVMIDTLVNQLPKLGSVDILGRIGLEKSRYFVSTFHRPSNVDQIEDLTRVIEILESMCSKTSVVLPLHPRTAASLERHGLRQRVDQIDGLYLQAPLGYLEFMKLVVDSAGVVTDSGGIQEETTYLQLPCITMRDNTERPITVEIGTNVLAGKSKENVLNAFEQVLDGSFKKGEVPELWDGSAASRIANILCETF